jgi:GT2 family glycosyltransferase
VKVLPSERERPDISVVIVHHDTPDLLFRCMAALSASTGAASIEVLVVDNATPGFQPADALIHYPAAQVISNRSNVGFARAANVCLALARGRYLLLLNPDAFVAPDTLSRMVDFMDANADVGCSTARLVLEDGSLDLACRRSFPTPSAAFFRLSHISRLFPTSRRLAGYNLGHLDQDEEAEIDAPCGAFMMVRREVAEQVGLLDERYFMYGEDLDWAYRIKAAGWRVTYTPVSTVTHVKRASSRRFRDRTIRAFHDAMRIFYRTHYEPRYPGWLSWLVYRAIDGRELVELTGHRLRSYAARAGRRHQPAGL